MASEWMQPERRAKRTVPAAAAYLSEEHRVSVPKSEQIRQHAAEMLARPMNGLMARERSRLGWETRRKVQEES